MCLSHNLYRILRKQRSKMGRRNGENSGTNPRATNISHEVRLMVLTWAFGPLPWSRSPSHWIWLPTSLQLSLSVSILHWVVLLALFGISNGNFFLSFNKGKINQLLSEFGNGSYCTEFPERCYLASSGCAHLFLFFHRYSVRNVDKAGGMSESVINSQPVRSLQSSRPRV